MTTREITSLQNPRVKEAIKLRDSRARARQERFLIDGSREILQAVRGKVAFDEVFVCEPLCRSDESYQALAAFEKSQTTVWQVTPAVFEKLAFGDRTEGVLAVATTPKHMLSELRMQDDGLIAVVEGLEKPGNVGAIVRSADAAGVGAVIVADPRTDLYNQNCIRASLGTVFTLPICTATVDETIHWLLARSSKIIVARPDAARNYTEVDYQGNVAIVLGSEAAGLSDAWQRAAITPIKLPMRGTADSLNVSATAAVLFYEALRQRSS